MDLKIHSVRLEHNGPGPKDLLKAAFSLVTGKFGAAQDRLMGDTKLVARNADGQLVMGISGGRDMTIYTT